MKTKISIGNNGENLAVEFLEKQGIKVIERNWRYSRVGEIDIIAHDGETLVFIEVKTRSTANFGHPLEVISTNKLNTIYKLAEIYTNNCNNKNYKGIRIDIIGILAEKDPEITHIKGVCQ